MKGRGLPTSASEVTAASPRAGSLPRMLHILEFLN